MEHCWQMALRKGCGGRAGGQQSILICYLYSKRWCAIAGQRDSCTTIISRNPRQHRIGQRWGESLMESERGRLLELGGQLRFSIRVKSRKG